MFDNAQLTVHNIKVDRLCQPCICPLIAHTFPEMHEWTPGAYAGCKVRHGKWKTAASTKCPHSWPNLYNRQIQSTVCIVSTCSCAGGFAQQFVYLAECASTYNFMHAICTRLSAFTVLWSEPLYNTTCCKSQTFMASQMADMPKSVKWIKFALYGKFLLSEDAAKWSLWNVPLSPSFEKRRPCAGGMENTHNLLAPVAALTNPACVSACDSWIWDIGSLRYALSCMKIWKRRVQYPVIIFIIIIIIIKLHLFKDIIFPEVQRQPSDDNPLIMLETETVLVPKTVSNTSSVHPCSCSTCSSLARASDEESLSVWHSVCFRPIGDSNFRMFIWFWCVDHCNHGNLENLLLH